MRWEALRIKSDSQQLASGLKFLSWREIHWISIQFLSGKLYHEGLHTETLNMNDRWTARRGPEFGDLILCVERGGFLNNWIKVRV